MNYYLFLCALFFQYVFGATYHYHPSTTLYLGSGFNPLHTDTAFGQCLTYDGVTKVDGTGAVETLYSLSLVKSKKDLFNQLSISASMSAQSLFWSADGGIDYFSEHKFHSDSITWMVLAKSDYGRYVLNNVQLTKEAQTLLDAKKHEEFARRCGTEFVNQQKKAVMAAAIFTVSNLSQENKSKLTAHFKGSYSEGFFNADVETKYKSFFSEAMLNSRMAVSVYAIGGAGITYFSSLVSNSGELRNIQKVVAEYVKTLDSDNAVPMQYLSGSMEIFGYRGQNPANIYKRNRVLGYIYHNYENAVASAERLRDIISLQDITYFKFLTKKQLKQYLELYLDIENYIAELLEMADICYDDVKNCQIPQKILPFVVWPMGKASFCEQKRLKAYHVGLLNDEELQRLRIYNLIPIYRNLHRGLEAEVFCQGE